MNVVQQTLAVEKINRAAGGNDDHPRYEHAPVLVHLDFGLRCWRGGARRRILEPYDRVLQLLARRQQQVAGILFGAGAGPLKITDPLIEPAPLTPDAPRPTSSRVAPTVNCIPLIACSLGAGADAAGGATNGSTARAALDRA